ncbi:hypothetical protein [Lyngbya aestuarii]|uniref:hypothetical protein n=1 Tax=Lyngbya aestuarii TaxID=118322 RepID=UPI00403E3416
MPAEAFNIGFGNVTNHGATNVAPNFSVNVEDIGGGKVQFKFNNSGATAPATINEIYFWKNKIHFLII